MRARNTAPASRSRAAGGASCAAGTSSVAAVPSGTGTPFVAGSPTSTGTVTPGGFGAPVGGFDEVRINGAAQTWFGTTLTPTFVWRHDGPIWKMDAGAGWSRASLHTRNIDKGYFGASQARRTGVVVSFADIFYLRPNTITVTWPSSAARAVASPRGIPRAR